MTFPHPRRILPRHHQASPTKGRTETTHRKGEVVGGGWDFSSSSFSLLCELSQHGGGERCAGMHKTAPTCCRMRSGRSCEGSCGRTDWTGCLTSLWSVATRTLLLGSRSGVSWKGQKGNEGGRIGNPNECKLRLLIRKPRKRQRRHRNETSKRDPPRGGPENPRPRSVSPDPSPDPDPAAKRACDTVKFYGSGAISDSPNPPPPSALRVLSE